MNLKQFFPDKGLLLADEDLRRRFFEKNDLFNRGNRVAFVAGLMDGDGTCRAYWKSGKIKWKGAFGKIQVKWLFSQTSFPFLLDFFEDFVRQIAPNSLTIIRRDGRVEGASINRRGREALLRVGIAKWSSKARRWMDEVSRLLKKREEKKAEWIDKIGHLGVKLRDAAKMVGVSRARLSQLHGSGSLLALRVFEGKRAILVVPTNEVERLRRRYLETENRAERIRRDGMTLSDLSKVIGVSPSTLHRWYQRGHLKALLVRNRDHRCLVVPKKEVDRIRAKHLMSSNQQTVARRQ
jgi:transposase